MNDVKDILNEDSNMKKIYWSRVLRLYLIDIIFVVIGLLQAGIPAKLGQEALISIGSLWLLSVVYRALRNLFARGINILFVNALTKETNTKAIRVYSTLLNLGIIIALIIYLPLIIKPEILLNFLGLVGEEYKYIETVVRVCAFSKIIHFISNLHYRFCSCKKVDNNLIFIETIGGILELTLVLSVLWTKYVPMIYYATVITNVLKIILYRKRMDIEYKFILDKGDMRRFYNIVKPTMVEVAIRTGVDLYVVRQIALLDVTYLAIAPVLDSTLYFAGALGAPLDSTSRLFMTATSKNKEKFRETINLKSKADYLYILFLFVIGLPTALFYDKILKVENLDIWFYVFVCVGLIGKFLTYKVSVEGSICTIQKQDNYLAKVSFISESLRLVLFLLLINIFEVYTVVIAQCVQLGIGYIILRPKVKKNIKEMSN